MSKTKEANYEQEKAYLELSDKMYEFARIFGFDDSFVQDTLTDIEETVKKEKKVTF